MRDIKTKARTRTSTPSAPPCPSPCGATRAISPSLPPFPHRWKAGQRLVQSDICTRPLSGRCLHDAFTIHSLSRQRSTQVELTSCTRALSYKMTTLGYHHSKQPLRQSKSNSHTSTLIASTCKNPSNPYPKSTTRAYPPVRPTRLPDVADLQFTPRKAELHVSHQTPLPRHFIRLAHLPSTYTHNGPDLEVSKRRLRPRRQRMVDAGTKGLSPAVGPSQPLVWQSHYDPHDGMVDAASISQMRTRLGRGKVPDEWWMPTCRR